MAETTMNDRLTKVETRAEEYLKRSEVVPTLVRIETKLDNQKWILGAIVAFLVALAAGLIVGLVVLVLQLSP